MGKQRSKDKLYINQKEHIEHGTGFKDKSNLPFRKLPLHCCALSLQPLRSPVCTKNGSVFDADNIVPYIKKFKVNPVNGEACSIGELVPMTFHKNTGNRYHDPIIEKEFSDHHKIACIRTTGQVYLMETLETMNKKTKNFSDLITGKKFKWSDVVLIQNPDNPLTRQIDQFFYMLQGQQEMVQAAMNTTSTGEPKDGEQIRMDESMLRVQEEKQKMREERIARGEDGDLKANIGQKKEEEDPTQPPQKKAKHSTYTTGMAAASFTSTAFINHENTSTEFRDMTEEEMRKRVYDRIRKKKTKGYVRMVTQPHGIVNIELHCDIAPLACDNFLRLIKQGYYDGTIFHRCIKNFMIQGGDPTGTGKGGKSAFHGGKPFRDEFDSRLSFDAGGMLAMANSGKNTNKSQFFLTFKQADHLNNVHTLFGRVVGGMDLLKQWNLMETGDKDKPIHDIKIAHIQIFANPFEDAEKSIEDEENEEKQKELAKLKDKEVAEWFSANADPMKTHSMRNSSEVGKYMVQEKLDPQAAVASLSAEEKEYALVAPKKKDLRTGFAFDKW